MRLVPVHSYRELTQLNLAQTETCRYTIAFTQNEAEDEQSGAGRFLNQLEVDPDGSMYLIYAHPTPGATVASVSDDIDSYVAMPIYIYTDMIKRGWQHETSAPLRNNSAADNTLWTEPSNHRQCSWRSILYTVLQCLLYIILCPSDYCRRNCNKRKKLYSILSERSEHSSAKSLCSFILIASKEAA